MLYKTSDTTIEILMSIVVLGSENQTFTEKRSTAEGLAKSISLHYTKERIEMAPKEYVHLWQLSFTFDVIDRTDLE